MCVCALAGPPPSAGQSPPSPLLTWWPLKSLLGDPFTQVSGHTVTCVYYRYNLLSFSNSFSEPKITRVHTADSAHFKTPPLKETAQLVCKEPSPASLHSLLHGEILAHQQTTPHSRARPSFPESPLKQAWLANQSSPIMFSSPVIDKDDCNVIGRTPSKGGQSVAKTTQETNSSWSTGRTARMLTYDNQLSKQMLELPSPKETTPPCILEEERTILDIPSLYTPHNNTQPDTWNVPEAMDPSIETESASMMAFALCTPTKEDRRDFHEAFLD